MIQVNSSSFQSGAGVTFQETGPCVVRVQGQCPATRRATAWERVKMMLGWFEKSELQCLHYADHREHARNNPSQWSQWWHEAGGVKWQTEEELEEYDRWLS